MLVVKTLKPAPNATEESEPRKRGKMLKLAQAKVEPKPRKRQSVETGSQGDRGVQTAKAAEDIETGAGKGGQRRSPNHESGKALKPEPRHQKSPNRESGGRC